MYINFLKKLISISLLIILTTTAIQAEVLTVTSNANAGDGTLRAKIAEAATNGEANDVINFAADLPPIVLTAEIPIPENLTIIGTVEISGGGVTRIFNIPENNKVTLEGLTLKNGSADNGGAIHNEGELCLKGATLKDNTATNNGGAVLSSGNLRVLDHTTFTGNNAVNGGAIHSTGNLEIAKSGIVYNTASDKGGGIYASGSASHIHENSVIQHNTATDGGGIYNEGTMTVDRSIILSNVANNEGGGIYNYYDLTIQNNSLVGENTANRGGGIYNNNVTCTISKSSIAINHALFDGGGIYNTGLLHIVDESQIFKNQAELDGGGGIYNNGTCTINLSYVRANEAKIGAGAFNTGTLTIEHSELLSNIAEDVGGGVYSTDILNIQHSKVLYNISTTTDGGGIFNIGTATINQSEIRGNSAERNGGGICNTSEMDITNSQIQYNTAMTSSGGGLYNSEGAVASLNDSSVKGNVAVDGGGIYNTGDLDIDNSDVKENTANNNGGGIYNTGNMSINRSWTQLNTATAGSGGGIYNSTNANLTVSNCSDIVENLAEVDGGGLYNDGTAHIQDVNILDNEAKRNGGGIFTQVLLQLKRSTLARNKAVNGGCIYNTNDLEVQNSTFSANEAIADGGGLFDEGTSSIYNSTFTLNVAVRGGGIARFPEGGGTSLSSTIVAKNMGMLRDIFLNADIMLLTTLSNNFIGNNATCAGVFPASPSPIIPNENGDYVGPDPDCYDPLLSPLVEDGAWSLVHIPLHCSPVIDRGSNPLDLDTDQRGGGFLREVGYPDIGAVEVQEPHPDNPPPPIVPDQYICVGEPIDIILDGNPDIFYEITGLTGTLSDLPGGTILTYPDLATIGLDNTVSGTYTFILQASSFDECDNESVSTEFSITVHDTPIITTTILNPTCDNPDGQIIVTADGGTPPYEYSIDDGATFSLNDTFVGLSTGDYHVVVRDINTCLSNTETVTLIDDCPPVDDYCTPQGIDSSVSWIEQVTFCDIDNPSGNDGGYGDYTNMVGNVVAGQVPQIFLDAQFNQLLIGVRWHVWIDFNQDGTFDVNERVVSTQNTGVPIFAPITIPHNASIGQTRMRVKMVTGRSIGANPCGNNERGEVEDYTVNISSGTGLVAPPSGFGKQNSSNMDLVMKIFPNPVREQATIEFELPNDNPVTLFVTDVNGKSLMLLDNELMPRGTHQITLNGSDLPAGTYYCTLKVGKAIKVEQMTLVKK